MDGFIDRLAEFLRTLMGSDSGTTAGRSTGTARGQYRDPDLQDAWEELDNYMKGGTRERTSQAGSRGPREAAQPIDESLRKDYANLEVPFGADLETVRKSYKTLMMRYHPDKHAGDPEKQRIALEITKKVNQSFERIRNRQQAGR